MDQRKQALATWARQCLQQMSAQAPVLGTLETVSGDASFRRYFRLRFDAALSCDSAPLAAVAPASLQCSQFVLVDAPPEHEDNPRFVRVAEVLRGAGLRTPRVLQVDYAQGFLLLEDFGDTLYLPALQAEDAVDARYGAAMQALIHLQAHGSSKQLPPYDRALLRRELALFDDWFCERFLGLSLTDAERALLARTWTLLEDAALAQTQTCVHRDYHSRNLMILSTDPHAAPGVIDFQDAVRGPYTYDLVSLLRDCYIVWPQEKVRAWALQFRQMALAADVLPADAQHTEARFLRDFDLMGLQRHIKVIGIFCRLNLRDAKPRYMADIPLVIDYVLSVSASHPEMAEFRQWFQNRLLPLANERLATYAAQGVHP